MNNLPKLLISIGDTEILIIAGYIDEQYNFKLFEKLNLPIDDINNNRIKDLDKLTKLIKKNIFIIEQKVNYTFKDIIVIINNFKISFLNLCGFKKLNGTQILKENITYIINSLKSYVDEFERNKKILHIFNSEYSLDKKKLSNLPIGLFGDFYSHELSFNLINKNDYKNLEYIFSQCNLKIKKLLLENFVKGAIVNELNPKADTFYYIQINKTKSKIFYVENSSIKYEQIFDFGTEIILNDICKITSLTNITVKNIIAHNKNIIQISDTELLEEKYFSNKQFRKIRKNLIAKIADARINELCELFYLKNVNLKKSLRAIKLIFLEINDQQHHDCFKQVYEKNFSYNSTFEIKIIKEPTIEEKANKAYNIAQFGWKNEAIPIARKEKSLITKFFRAIFG